MSARLWGPLAILACAATEAAFFEIQVEDEATGRGVPLIELEAVNRVRFLTDSAGRIALQEPGFEGKQVFFHVRGHGYEFPKDGFGYAGVRLKVAAGGRELIRVKRLNIAERLYRTTGEGIYRDSVLLGYGAPVERPVLNAEVLGQDSVQRVIYQGQIHWFWGDTLRISYPLGNFRMAGAVSDWPGKGGADPAEGIDLRYFTTESGFAKEMFPLEPKGNLIWADGFLTAPDEAGRERLLAHYQRLKGLGQALGRGLAIYNDDRAEFEALKTLPLEEEWRFPQGHPVLVTNQAQKHFGFGAAFPVVRAPARLGALLDPGAYEAYSCLEDGSPAEPAGARVLRNEAGEAVYRWTRHAPPATPKLEAELVKAGRLAAADARFLPVDAATGQTVQIHAGTVSWNAWRKRWILVGVQLFGSSVLGEIWYAEAEDPQGPWKKARKIVTHDRYSFYNPAHHPFLDQQGGRVIYFEGTYTAEFSGNPAPTPRYDYNQIVYRLDLADPRLQDVQN